MSKLDAIAAHGNRGHAAAPGAPWDDSHIRCADGSVLSVIAGFGAHYPGPYTHVEVMPIEGDWPAEWFGDDSVATVAVENVSAEFAKRGGEAQDHPFETRSIAAVDAEGTRHG